MLLVETPSGTTNRHLAGSSLSKRPNAKSLHLVTPKTISVTFSSVEMDGRHLINDPKEVSVARLAEAMRLAQMHEKEVLMITNFAPGTKTCDQAAAKVPLIMREIQEMLELACADTLRGVPESRLDLHGGEYGLRCYLGRTKPTDFIFAEDRLSDSR